MYHVKLRNGQIDHAELIKYPDGQYNIKLDLNYFHDRKQEINITCNIVEFADWEKLLALIGAFKRADFLINEINFVYIMGCRSDRQFESGMPNYVSDVMLPIMNFIKENCRAIKYLVPHGRTMNILPTGVFHNNLYFSLPKKIHNTIKIAADESAVNLISNYQDFHEKKTPFFLKKREGENIYMGISMEHHATIAESDAPIAIFDDLCDGGRTFIEIGKYLIEHFPDRKKYLFVIHGLFSKGTVELFEYYDEIYATNSYPFSIDAKVQLIDVWNTYDR